jgi:gluconolactonase
MANGMTLDRDGSLLICEQGTTTDAARISRMDLPTGQIETVVDGWFGLPFNSLNDVVVRRADGTIWFTDPSYGYLQDFRPAPQSGNYIYRFDPATRWLEVVADGFSMPNGLAFSPDDSILYVTDSGAIQEPGSYTVTLPHHVIALDVVNGRRLANARLFATITPGVPDGIKLDTAGNVYTGCGDGVQVFDPDGIMIGKILIEGGVPNLTFGGPGNDTLYICADTYIYAVKLNATGAGCGH